MSDNNFNVTALPAVASQSIGSNPQGGAFKEPVRKNVVETVKIPGFAGAAAPPKNEEPVSKEPVKETKQEASRHDKWKEQQAIEKAKRVQDKYNKTVERQKTAPELLKAGDVNGAAKALGIDVTELITLTNRAALAIPTKPEEMTAEQKRDKELNDYKASVAAELEEHRRYRQTQQEREVTSLKTKWQTENIFPLMDEEKYPLITQNKEAIPSIMSGLYEYFNQKFIESEKDEKGNGWTPSKQDIEDALETMEAQYEERAQKQLEAYKGVKKFSKYFSNKEEQIEMALEEAPKEAPKPSSNNRNYNVFQKKADGEVPFALLSNEEKMKYLLEHA